jgi:hypothetical protein
MNHAGIDETPWSGVVSFGGPHPMFVRTDLAPRVLTQCPLRKRRAIRLPRSTRGGESWWRQCRFRPCRVLLHRQNSRSSSNNRAATALPVSRTTKAEGCDQGHHPAVKWSLIDFDGCAVAKSKEVKVQFQDTPPFTEICIRTWSRSEYGQSKSCPLDPMAPESDYHYDVKFDNKVTDPELIVRRPVRVELTLTAAVCSASGDGSLLANAEEISFDVQDTVVVLAARPSRSQRTWRMSTPLADWSGSRHRRTIFVRAGASGE